MTKWKNKLVLDFYAGAKVVSEDREWIRIKEAEAEISLIESKRVHEVAMRKMQESYIKELEVKLEKLQKYYYAHKDEYPMDGE